MATVGEFKALLEGKNDEDVVEVVMIPNYNINIKPAEVKPEEPTNEATGDAVEADVPVGEGKEE